MNFVGKHAKASATSEKESLQQEKAPAANSDQIISSASHPETMEAVRDVRLEEKVSVTPSSTIPDSSNSQNKENDKGISKSMEIPIVAPDETIIVSSC